MRAVDRVSGSLRERVLTGELAPGEPLAEVDVAQQYGVARPTAKLAIEGLVGERMLERSAHRTARVVRLTPDEAADVYRSREVLEVAAVRGLAAVRAVPPAAERANDDIVRMVNARAVEIVEPDMRFHGALVAEVGSPRLSAMYASLVAEVRLCMAQVQGSRLLSTELIIDEHRRILDAIARGDADEAATLVSGHIGRARDRLVAALRTGAT